MTDRDWWRQSVVYQVYPRSFADADGDGVGDLPGVTSRVPYLAALGVDAVWLSPFYPSALADGGYDVDDYRDVDPRLGTLDDFDAMSAALHDAGIKVIVDIVPNHTSDRHAWFQEAVAAGPGSRARERYIFRDGAGPDGSMPPNDWESVFGGPAWHQVPDGQWYLHLFAPQQPDLNWDDREVRDDFLSTLRFWSDRGVDGFRVDVAHALAKDLSEPYATAAELADGEQPIGGSSNPLWDRDEVSDIYAEWRAVFDEYDPPRSAVAEAWVPAHRRARYASPEGLGQAFNFDLLRAPWDEKSVKAVIEENLDLALESGATSTWVLSNHDVVRHATRYGLPQPSHPLEQDWLLSGGAEPPLDRLRGLDRARAATLMMLALPGSAYLYQGEELGLHEVAELEDADLEDPIWERTDHTVKGRDGCRVPLPWTRGGPSYGFGPGGAHLPQPRWFADVAVAVQEADPTSTLTLYRTALELRRSLIGAEHVGWGDAPEGVVHLVRPGGWHSVTNLGELDVPLPEGRLLLASRPLSDGRLPPDATAWLSVG
ncbi:MAG: alpha-glucosidase [Nocardioidaceae bacterium]|nr:alpha-glucosidase [Nocardioidaceae bacterium]